MTTITLKGQAIHTNGELPAVGTTAAKFAVTDTSLKEISSQDFAGKTLVLNIFPSVDTEVCATSVRKFNEKAANLKDTAVLCLSMDLPFALGRFCGASNIKDVITASVFRNPEFAKNYGVEIIDGPLRGLLSRAIVIINAAGKIIYTEQVPEIVQEPDYEDALAAII